MLIYKMIKYVDIQWCTKNTKKKYKYGDYNDVQKIIDVQICWYTKSSEFSTRHATPSPAS